MNVIVDTYNVLHVTGVLPPELAGVEVDGLMDLLERGRWGRSRIALACDGTPPGGTHPANRGGIQVLYSGPGREADDLICERIEASTAPTRLLVVSSDRRIIKAARRRRCRTMDSKAFLQTIVHDVDGRARTEQVRRPDRLNPREVEDWKKHFALGSEDLQQFEQLAKPDPPPEKVSKATQKPAKPKPTTRSPGDQPLPDSVIEEARRMLEEEG